MSTYNLTDVPNLTPDTELTTQNEIIPHILTLTANYGKATQFMYKLFLRKPELFGVNASSLMYILFCGKPNKIDALYAEFQQFVAHKSFTSSSLYPYASDCSALISWARVIRENKKAVVFEPILSKLNQVLNTFYDNPVVSIEGSAQDIKKLRPLCYTKTGENYLSLLPYIAYVFTFLVHCKPYDFNETISSASYFAFIKEINRYFNVQLTAFGSDNGVNVVESDIASLNKIQDDKYKAMINYVLDPKQITKLRNEILNQEEGLLDNCIEDQNALSDAFVKKAFHNTLAALISIVIEHNPIKQLIDRMPVFQPQHYNSHELSMLTQYCMAGGDMPFLIDDQMAYVLHNKPASVKQFSFFKPQHIASKINVITKSSRHPFTTGDIYLNLVSAYVKDKIDKKRSDPLSADPIAITLSDDDLIHNVKSIASSLIDLFAQGRWMKDNSTLLSMMPHLLGGSASGNSYTMPAANVYDSNNGAGINLANIQEFKYEFADIIELSTLIQDIYHKPMAAAILPAYMIAIMPEFFLQWMEQNLALNKFQYFLCFFDHEINQNYLRKLIDMTNSLLYIKNKDYQSYVNAYSKEICAILDSSETIVHIPYIKGLNDSANVYAIGGVDLYNIATVPNSVIRSYEFIKYNFGSNEELDTVHRFASAIDSTGAFATIDSATDASVVTATLKPLFEKAYPKVRSLNNFSFDSTGAYARKPFSWILDLTETMNTIHNFIFPKSDISKIINQTIITRQIDLHARLQNSDGTTDTAPTITVSSPQENYYVANNTKIPVELLVTGVTQELPVYDVRGVIQPVRIKMTNPPGLNLIALPIPTITNEKGFIAWIHTSRSQADRFATYEMISNSTQPAESDGIIIDRIVPKAQTIEYK